jgi:hypothetical protein
MDPVTSGAALAVITVGADLVRKMLGPVAEQIGSDAKSRYAEFYNRNQTAVLEAAFTQIQEAGFEPKAVDPKVSVALLRAAGLEQDSYMQDKWAALLTNAANPRQVEVSPMNVNILSQLSSRNAKFLDACFDQFQMLASLGRPKDIGVSVFDVDRCSLGDSGRLLYLYANAGLTHLKAEALAIHGKTTGSDEDLEDRKNFRIDFDALLSLGLLRANTETKYQHGAAFPTNTSYHFTAFGYNFVALCRPSKRDAPEAEA